MWTVKKVNEGTKAGAFRVQHSGGYVHAYFKLKSTAILEARHLNRIA